VIRNKNQYIVYYLKENILILDVFGYLECLAAETVDYLAEWHLLNDNKVKFKKTIIVDFLNKKIQDFCKDFIDMSKKIDCLMFCFYKENENLKQWQLYYEDPVKFIKCCKLICKKNLPNFFENKNEDFKYFQTIKGTFQDIPCLLPTGEDELFLQKIRKKIK